VKQVGNFTKDERQDAALLGLFVLGTAVHENVRLPGVAVKVTNHHALTLLVKHFNQPFYVVNRWV
jgi:hypothetical protein